VPVNRVVAFPVLATARSALAPVWDALWMTIADANFDGNETMQLGTCGRVDDAMANKNCASSHPLLNE
jgi:hypothetical protein